MKIVKISRANLQVVPIQKGRRVVEFDVCPHCGKEILEKWTFSEKIGDTTYTYHRGCHDKAPIDSFTDEEARRAFENTFFGQQWLSETTTKPTTKQASVGTVVTPDFCRRLRNRSNEGYVPNNHEKSLVESAWLQLQEKSGHSTGGRSHYPHIDFWQKVRDIEASGDSGKPQTESVRIAQAQPNPPNFQNPQQNPQANVFHCPDIRVGDTIMVGKYKHVETQIAKFGVDENGQPTLTSTEGVESKMFTFRLKKLMDNRIGQKTAQNLSLVKIPEELNDRELLRAIRDAIIAEETAIQQYEVIVDATNDASAKKVLQDIAEEEKVHVGELQRLLEHLDGNESKKQAEGAKETEENLE